MSRATERLYQGWTSEGDTPSRSKLNPYYTVEEDEAMQRAESLAPRGDVSSLGVALVLVMATMTTLIIGGAIWHVMG